MRGAGQEGWIRGTYDGPFDEGIISFLRRAWTEACAADGEAHMTFDEPLRQLSRIGCTHRHQGGAPDCSHRTECPIGNLCPRGTIALSVERVRIDV